MITSNGCRFGVASNDQPPAQPPAPHGPVCVAIAPMGDGTVHLATVAHGHQRTLVLTRDGAAAVLERLALAVLAEFGVALYAASIAPAQGVVTARLNELIDRAERGQAQDEGGSPA